MSSPTYRKSPVIKAPPPLVVTANTFDHVERLSLHSPINRGDRPTSSIINDHDTTIISNDDSSLIINMNMVRHRLLLHTLNLWTLTSLAWIILSTFVLAQVSAIKFGNEDVRTQYRGASSLPLLYGIILILLSLVGHLCQHYRLNPIIGSKFNSEQIYTLFIIMLILTITIEIVGLSAICAMIIRLLLDSENYNSLEQIYIFIFNNFYFATANKSSNAVSPSSFWSWIRDNCPSSLYKDICMKNFAYSVTSCGADEYTCREQGGSGYACPYTICRDSVLQFSTYALLGICVSTLWFLALQSIVLFFLFGTLGERKKPKPHSHDIEAHQTRPESPARPTVAMAAKELYHVMAHPNIFLFNSDDEIDHRSNSPHMTQIFSDEWSEEEKGGKTNDSKRIFSKNSRVSSRRNGLLNDSARDTDDDSGHSIDVDELNNLSKHQSNPST